MYKMKGGKGKKEKEREKMGTYENVSEIFSKERKLKIK
jgi:hypothetical protein